MAMKFSKKSGRMEVDDARKLGMIFKKEIYDQLKSAAHLQIRIYETSIEKEQYDNRGQVINQGKYDNIVYVVSDRAYENIISTMMKRQGFFQSNRTDIPGCLRSWTVLG